MIHYHGTPITPQSACVAVLSGRHAFVSFARPQDLEIVEEVCQSFALDNGAFSAWRHGEPVNDWRPYYDWVHEHSRHPAFDWAVIPDVIDGDEQANDALVAEWPESLAPIGVPVWHMHESLNRLRRLVSCFHRVALGSSGPFAMVGTEAWWRRISEAMAVACSEDGQPFAKLHGLRMLDPAVFSRIPFAGADSTNIGQNIGIDTKWRGTYQPPDKAWRAQVLAARIEATQSPGRWVPSPQLAFQLTA